MSKSGGERHRRRGVVGAALLTALAAATPALAMPPLTGIEIPPPSRQTLLLLHEQWGDWLRSFYQGDAEGSEEAVDDLLVTCRQLGMERLPDLSLAAAARALEAAREADFDRARQALDAAERLDPGRPETAFASAAVARLKDGSLAAVDDALRGYARLLRLPATRRLAAHGAGVFALYVLLVAGALFVALQMATRGGRLLNDLAAAAGRWLPVWLAYSLALAALLWPLALPRGLLWLIAWWALLLWGYAAASERAVTVGLVLLLGAAPLLLAEQRLRIGVDLSRPVRALDGVVSERLYGGLFEDLAALTRRYPQSPAVRQALADVNRRLGAWEWAATLYRDVKKVEPQNAAALLDLGAYYFFTGDQGAALREFKAAAAASPDDAAAYFNISQAYSEDFHFDYSKAARAQARALDPKSLDRWLGESAHTRVLTRDGGFERVPQIRRRLLADARPEPLAATLRRPRMWGSLAAAGGLLLAAVLWQLLGRRVRRVPASAPAPEPGRWLRALVPGLVSSAARRGPATLAALLPVVALALLPLAGRFAYPLPLGVASGELPVAVAVAGLAAVLAFRLWRELRRAA